MVTKRKFWQRLTAVFLSAMLFAGTLGDGTAYVKAEELTDSSDAGSGGEKNNQTGGEGETTEHKHKICADAACTDSSHEDITWTAWTQTDSLPTEAGSYYLTQDVTLTDSWEVSVKDIINICFHGHIVKIDSPNKPVMIVKDPGNTTWYKTRLTDCSNTVHKFSVERDTGLWILDEQNGTETLTGGCITGARGGEGEACPAVVNEARACIEMYHINIVGNKNGGEMYLSQYSSADSKGKGGSALYNAGTFSLNSGNIVGNYMDMSMMKEYEAKKHAGGCVFIEKSGKFTMDGGKIYKNGGEHNTCGGVFTNGGKFTMNAGEISENSGVMGGGILALTDSDFGNDTVTLNAGKITNNNAKQGGGIYCHCPSSDFIINGGEITGNTAQEGGGVWLESNDVFEGMGPAVSYDSSSKFVINGGTITDNYEILKDNKTDDEHRFASNLYLNADWKTCSGSKYNICKQIVIKEGTGNEALRIGITIGGISDNDLIFTRERGTEWNDNIFSCLESDDPVYKIEKNEGGKQLCLKMNTEETYTQIAAVRKQINDIEKGDYKEYGTLCNAAREAYNALSEEQRGLMNYAVLRKLQNMEFAAWIGATSGKEGTEENPYTLSQEGSCSIWNLYRYFRSSNACGLRDIYFKLQGDLDIAYKGDYWIIKIIGWPYKEGEIIPFLGNLDGNGYAITGLDYGVRRDGGYVRDCVGLFAHNKGTIQNLTVVGEYSDVDNPDLPSASERNYIGGIAGKNEGKIINCDSIVKINGKDYVGGITGANLENGIIKNCHSAENVAGTGSNVGGIAGENKGIIKGCFYEKNDLINKDIFGVGGVSRDPDGIEAVNGVHAHASCGEKYCSSSNDNSHFRHHDHIPRVWEPWLKSDSLPTDKGNYYLTTDVALPEGYVLKTGDSESVFKWPYHQTPKYQYGQWVYSYKG